MKTGKKLAADITDPDDITREFDTQAFLCDRDDKLAPATQETLYLAKLQKETTAKPRSLNHRSSRIARRQFSNHPPCLDKDETSADRRTMKTYIG